jgi:ATP-dependent Clp protease ATP-binding subunit ClpA
MQGYNYTESLRRALVVARQEASALQHSAVSPEHFLLGLASSEDPTLLQIWSRLGIDSAVLRRATLASTPSGEAESTSSELPFTSSAKRVIVFAMSEASVLKDADGLGPEHLLLGITRLDAEAAARVLRDLGVTNERVREVLALVRGRPLPELAVASIEIRVALRDGAVIQQTFAGGDAEALQFVSQYLFL